MITLIDSINGAIKLNREIPMGRLRNGGGPLSGNLYISSLLMDDSSNVYMFSANKTQPSTYQL